MNEAPLMLSVSGMRGLVGQSLTPPVAARYAAAVGQWFKDGTTRHNGTPHIVLGRDSRPSGQLIEMSAAAGLIAVGCRVTCLGIVTTPGVAIMTEHLGADGGMVVTASHNPIVWNGIKTLRPDGAAPAPHEADEIIALFKADRVTYAPVDHLAPVAQDTTTHGVHVDRVLAHIDVAAVRARNLKVVLDSVHGAGGASAAVLLQRLGVELVHLYAQPTGRFPHEPEPTRENLTGLCDAVLTHRANLGFAQDPDADRLAVVDERGRYVGEEYTLALACMNVLSRPDCGPDALAVANLSTSRMIDDVAKHAGARVARTPVGEASVAAAIRAKHAVIGGEGNGGVIWPKVIHVRDSLVGIALLLELLARQDVPLSAIVDQIPQYAIVKDKIQIQPGMAQRCADALSSHFDTQQVDRQDGVRIDWPDQWVHVRPSNTEPILRIIAEARDEASARNLLDQTRQVLATSCA